MEQAEILIFYKLVYFQQVELLVLGKKMSLGFKGLWKLLETLSTSYIKNNTVMI